MAEQSKVKLVSAGVIVMVSAIVSRLTGYLREMLIPARFGVGNVADAYNAAFLLPDLMFNLLLGGAIAAAFIPTLSGYIERKEEEKGWNAISSFINVIIVSMLVFCIVGIIFTPQILSVVSKGLVDRNSEIRELAVRLTRILFPSVSFLMLAGICNGILNSNNRFAAAAFGPVIYNIGSIISLLLFGSNSAKAAELVAIGVLTSAFIYFIIQLTTSWKNLRYYRFTMDLKNPEFRNLFKLAVPSLFASSIVQVNVIVLSSFITMLGQGSLTLFNSANKTWQMPYGIFAISIGIAILPTLSGKYAVGEIKTYKNILNKGIKSVLAFSIPCAVGMVILREPVIRTLFKFDEKFNDLYVTKTGNILLFFSLAMVMQSLIAILNRGFYAINDTKTPLFVGFSTVAINAALCWIFFNLTNLGASGMALSYTTSSTVYTFMLSALLSKKLKISIFKDIKGFTLKVSAAALFMGILLYPFSISMDNMHNSKVLQIVILGSQVLFGAGVYLAGLIILKVDEGKSIYNYLKSKVSFLLKI